MIGTGLGLYRLRNGQRRATRITGELTSGAQSGTLSASLELRFDRSGRLLASGHPEAGGTLPENLGVIASDDQGETWEPLARFGQDDFHVLEPVAWGLVGVQADSDDVLVSERGVETFETRPAPSAPTDLDADPDDPKRLVIATERPLFSSSDQGRSWRPRDGAPRPQLVWASPAKLFRVDLSGQVLVSPNGGRTWRERGKLRFGPSELAADRAGNLYAGMPNATVLRSRDDGATWRALTRLRQARHWAWVRVPARCDAGVAPRTRRAGLARACRRAEADQTDGMIRADRGFEA